MYQTIIPFTVQAIDDIVKGYGGEMKVEFLAGIVDSGSFVVANSSRIYFIKLSGIDKVESRKVVKE